jgi:hypothetical protein
MVVGPGSYDLDKKILEPSYKVDSSSSMFSSLTKRHASVDPAMRNNNIINRTEVKLKRITELIDKSSRNEGSYGSSAFNVIKQ